VFLFILLPFLFVLNVAFLVDILHFFVFSFSLYIFCVPKVIYSSVPFIHWFCICLTLFKCSSHSVVLVAPPGEIAFLTPLDVGRLRAALRDAVVDASTESNGTNKK